MDFMKMCSIRSGSRGNAILIWTEKTKVLVDCGISGRATEEGLSEIGISPEEIDGILITHEHRDHTTGAGIFARRHGTPIFANQKTWSAMEEIVGEIKEDKRKTFVSNKYFSYSCVNRM